MDTTFLLFQLYGPMASWGEVAVGEERDSATHPTRSALLGLCAAAMGIPRTNHADLEGLNTSLGLALCLDEPGDLLRDYHTVQSPTGKGARDLPTRRDEIAYAKSTSNASKLDATLSKRHYRTDAFYTVCLWLRDTRSISLDDLAEGLRKPGFLLYLGRKSCPLALPLNPTAITADSILAAIQAYPVDERVQRLLGRSTAVGRPKSIFWDADTGGVPSGVEAFHSVQRWDQPVSRERWQFARRDEAFTRAPRVLEHVLQKTR